MQVLSAAHMIFEKYSEFVTGKDEHLWACQFQNCHNLSINILWP